MASTPGGNLIPSALAVLSDDELELGRLEHGQIERLFALDNPSDIVATMAIGFHSIGSVTDETTSNRELPPIVNNRDGIACSQRRELFGQIDEDRIDTEQQPADVLLNHGSESCFQVAFGTGR